MGYQDHNGKGLRGTGYKRVSLTWCEEVVDTEQSQKRRWVCLGSEAEAVEMGLQRGCVCMLLCAESAVVKQLSASFWF